MTRSLVLGAGSWGTALATQLAKCGSEVTLWARRECVARDISENARNAAYLGDVQLPPMSATTDLLDIASKKFDFVVSAMPSAYSAESWSVLKANNFFSPIMVSATKGFVLDDLGQPRLCTDVLASYFPKSHIGVLSGPSFAAELASSSDVSPNPTAVVVAGISSLTCFSAELFSSTYFRVYQSPDLIGVQIGGIVKNVIAIAAGISDGLSFGANARAALITRGLAEISRFAVALGGLTESMSGLSGMGDLILTCSDDQSRNRRVGLKVASLYREGIIRWETQQDRNPLLEWLKSHLFVPEGVVNCHRIREIASRHQVRMPIVEAVCAMLSCELSPDEAVLKLLASPAGEEYTVA